MGEENLKNSLKYDIKTSFLIANSFNAFIGGLFPLSVGTGAAVYQGLIPPVLCVMAVGVPIACFVLLGYYAAFKEHKKMLNIYSVLMGLVAALEALAVAADMLADMLALIDARVCVIFFLIHAGVSIAAMALALYLAKLLPSTESSKSTASGLGQCLKYFGYGVLAVLIVGFIANYFG